jgi:recombinational DNA repair protein (RecF pathway)
VENFELFENRRCSICGRRVFVYAGSPADTEELCAACREADATARAGAMSLEQMERQLAALEAEGNLFTSALRKMVERRRREERRT